MFVKQALQDTQNHSKGVNQTTYKSFKRKYFDDFYPDFTAKLAEIA